MDKPLLPTTNSEKVRLTIPNILRRSRTKQIAERNSAYLNSVQGSVLQEVSRLEANMDLYGENPTPPTDSEITKRVRVRKQFQGSSPSTSVFDEIKRMIDEPEWEPFHRDLSSSDFDKVRIIALRDPEPLRYAEAGSLSCGNEINRELIQFQKSDLNLLSRHDSNQHRISNSERFRDNSQQEQNRKTENLVLEPGRISLRKCFVTLDRLPLVKDADANLGNVVYSADYNINDHVKQKRERNDVSEETTSVLDSERETCIPPNAVYENPTRLKDSDEINCARIESTQDTVAKSVNRMTSEVNRTHLASENLIPTAAVQLSNSDEAKVLSEDTSQNSTSLFVLAPRSEKSARSPSESVENVSVPALRLKLKAKRALPAVEKFTKSLISESDVSCDKSVENTINEVLDPLSNTEVVQSKEKDPVIESLVPSSFEGDSIMTVEPIKMNLDLSCDSDEDVHTAEKVEEPTPLLRVLDPLSNTEEAQPKEKDPVMESLVPSSFKGDLIMTVEPIKMNLDLTCDSDEDVHTAEKVEQPTPLLKVLDPLSTTEEAQSKEKDPVIGSLVPSSFEGDLIMTVDSIKINPDPTCDSDQDVYTAEKAEEPAPQSSDSHQPIKQSFTDGPIPNSNCEKANHEALATEPHQNSENPLASKVLPDVVPVLNFRTYRHSSRKNVFPKKPILVYESDKQEDMKTRVNSCKDDSDDKVSLNAVFEHEVLETDEQILKAVLSIMKGTFLYKPIVETKLETITSELVQHIKCNRLRIKREIEFIIKSYIIQRPKYFQLIKNYVYDATDEDGIKSLPICLNASSGRFYVRLKCSVCGKVLTKRLYEEHTMNHANNRPYKCEKCGRGYLSEAALAQHLKDSKCSGILFKCKVCGKIYTCRTALKLHKKSHDPTNKKSYKCHLCDVVVCTPRSLKDHVARHTNSEDPNHLAKLFQCDVCGKQFADRRSLRCHNIRVHLKKKWYPTECDICNVKFKSSHHYRKHVIFHRKGIEKPLKCPHCDMRFTLKNVLNHHVMTHTGEKPHKCDICGHAFTQKVALNKHKFTHLGRKPYRCEKCGKDSQRKQDILKHKCPMDKSAKMTKEVDKADALCL